MDHQRRPYAGLRELALFAGAGGGILGGHLLGWRTVCAVEYEPYAAGVLVARQNDGLLPPFPIWDDVRTFDGRPWRGRVDVVSGGFPCQDISAAGQGAGLDGDRSGLWSEMARIVGEVRPRFVFVENSAALVTRGLGRVLGDLASLGFDAEWDVFPRNSLAPTISASVCGLLPTPTKSWGKRGPGISGNPEKMRASPSGVRACLAIVKAVGWRWPASFVEWMMGWPAQWSALKPLETAKFREWQQQHSPCSQPSSRKAA